VSWCRNQVMATGLRNQSSSRTGCGDPTKVVELLVVVVVDDIFECFSSAVKTRKNNKTYSESVKYRIYSLGSFALLHSTVGRFEQEFEFAVGTILGDCVREF